MPRIPVVRPAKRLWAPPKYNPLVDPQSRQRIKEMRQGSVQRGSTLKGGLPEDMADELKARLEKRGEIRKRNFERDLANAPSRSSNDSVDMSESEGSIPDDELEASKYPVEGRFKSEKDRDAIMALPEIQRETILAERAEELAKEDESRRLKALLHSYKGEKKRKAGEADLREPIKSNRAKTQKDKSLDELRRKREERGTKKTGQASKTRRSVSADIDADGESEVELEDRRREKTPERDATDLRDYEHIKVGYQNFAKICFYPNFDNSMVGCFVRFASAGQQPGRRSYRMAKIEEVVERHPYAMESSSGNGKKFVTTQHIVISTGRNKREVPFIFCSQGAFTQEELTEYLDTLRNDNLPLPKRSQLVARNSAIIKLLEHKFSEAELSAKVNRSAVLEANYREHKKSTLLHEKSRAERDGNEAAVQRIERQLSTVMEDSLNLRYGTSMPAERGSGASTTPSKPSEMNQQQRLGQLNRERAKADQQRIRNALLEEKRVAEKRRQKRDEADRAALARDSPMPRSTQDSNSATANGSDRFATSNASQLRKEVKIVNGKPVHNFFSATDDLELPYPEWSFNYVEYSNKYLGSRSMRHLSYDDKGRAVTDIPREMTDDEVIARMDIPMPLVPEY